MCICCLLFFCVYVCIHSNPNPYTNEPVHGRVAEMRDEFSVPIGAALLGASPWWEAKYHMKRGIINSHYFLICLGYVLKNTSLYNIFVRHCYVMCSNVETSHVLM